MAEFFSYLKGHAAAACVAAAALLLSARSEAKIPPLAGLEDEPAPVVHDANLALTLFAQTPQVVTPVGMAVDARGRVFVIESHTHSPPQGYAGPSHDQIKILEDTNGDHKADKVTVFSEGVLEDVMNLVFAPDGTLFAIHRLGATALPDRNNDGKADEHNHIVRVSTKQTYDHSGLLSGAIGNDGWLYLGRGNAAGDDYLYEGKASHLRSYGEGGHIVRCRLDGSQLERYATGFWNPFGLMFDGQGRLWAADNDPDSRGPNRLLQIVPGGDYGYRSRYGSSGLHPYVAWSGDLPGTLPYVAGVGESPGGLLDANTTAFPTSFRNNILVAVWAENSVERFAPETTDSGLTAKRQVLIKGGRNFRPVVLAAAKDGSVYLSDWVKREYPNHGLGRIWRLAPKTKLASHQRLIPRAAFAPWQPDPHTEKMNQLLDANASFEALQEALGGADGRLRAVASHRLSERPFRGRVMKLLRARDAKLRLGALQTLRWAGGPAYPFAPLGARLAPLLADPDEDVRIMALLYAGESVDLSLRPKLAAALTREPVGERLVQVYLATLALLTPAEKKHLAQRLPRATVTDRLDPSIAWQALQNRKLSANIHAMLLPYLGKPSTPAQLKLLLRLVASKSEPLRREAIRSLGLSDDAKAEAALVSVALNAQQPCALRQEAVGALAAHPQALLRLLPVLKQPESASQSAVALTLVRLLRSLSGEATVQEALAPLAKKSKPEALTSSVKFTMDPGEASGDPQRPQDSAAWTRATASGGDAAQGRHLFFSPLTACSQCHSVNARGGHIGPNLSHVGSSMDRARLLDSVLNPSAEVSPEFQAYAVVKKSGETLTGVQFHFRSPTSASMHLADGSDVNLKLSELESYGTMDTSLMPQGLDSMVTVEEIRDLLAFLESLR